MFITLDQRIDEGHNEIIKNKDTSKGRAVEDVQTKKTESLNRPINNREDVKNSISLNNKEVNENMSQAKMVGLPLGGLEHPW